MYQYTFDEDTTKKIKDSAEKTATIFDEFSKVDNKYSTLNSSDVGLEIEKMEFNKPTEEQVQTKAQNSLQEYKTSNIDSINQNFDKKTANIDSSIEKAKNETENLNNQIKAEYSNAKEKAKTDAIKRGLARSSIVVNTLANYDNNMLGELANSAEELNTKISNFNAQKDSLEIEKQNALNAFDIAYAVKLQEKIDDINSEIAKQEEEVIKYNNEIAKLEAEWKKQNQDDNFDKTTDLAKLIGEYSSSVFDILKQNEKYALAKEYFNSMPKEDAINELTNNTAYKSNLGNKNYQELLETLKAKK